jgi:hypothetical protein
MRASRSTKRRGSRSGVKLTAKGMMTMMGAPAEANRTVSNRVKILTYSSLICLACLVSGLAVLAKKNRLLVEIPVIATVGNVLTTPGKGGSLSYHAQLIFDRINSDGEVVHCDVKNVPLGSRSVTVGDTIKVAPPQSVMLGARCDKRHRHRPHGFTRMVAADSCCYQRFDFRFVALRVALEVQSKPS